MTPIKEYESHEFTDYEFEDEKESCEICGRDRQFGDSLCGRCREEYDRLYETWYATSNGVRDAFRKEISNDF